MRTLFILLLCFPALCRAEASSWDIRQLMQDLAQVKEAKGRFVERKFLNVLKRPLGVEKERINF